MKYGHMFCIVDDGVAVVYGVKETHHGHSTLSTVAPSACVWIVPGTYDGED